MFTFTWNNTDNFCAGFYTFELDLDSGQKFTSSPLQLNIDINDSNTSPHVTTVALPAGTVGNGRDVRTGIVDVNAELHSTSEILATI